MKKIIPFVIVMMITATSSFAQATREFQLKNFDKISMGSAFHIEIRPGAYKVITSGDQDDLDELEGFVSGSTLKLKFKNDKNWSWGYKNRKRINVVILLPQLKGIDLSGATTTTIEGFKNVEVFDFEVSGASKINASFTAKRVNLDISGASTINLSGGAEQMGGEISGATTFRAGDFVVKEVRLDISGASSAKLNVTKNLKADASGASSIRYTGNPENVNTDTSGASSIRKE